jgi:hypothetical protein
MTDHTMQGTLSYGEIALPCEVLVEAEPVMMVLDGFHYETVGVRRSWGIRADVDHESAAILSPSVGDKVEIHAEGEGFSVDGEAYLTYLEYNDALGIGHARYTGDGPLRGL